MELNWTICFVDQNGQTQQLYMKAPSENIVWKRVSQMKQMRVMKDVVVFPDVCRSSALT